MAPSHPGQRAGIGLAPQATTAALARSPNNVSFGPYRVVGALASGGMGVLYRGEHRETGAAVAIKTVIPAKEGVVGGMRTEIRALARLVHPGVARIVDEGVDAGQPWYAMELVEGKTLAKYRDELWRGLTGADLTTDIEGPLSSGLGTPPVAMNLPTTPPPPGRPGRKPAAAAGRLAEVLTIMQRLCAPLGHVHGRGIVHRDLKPENVLLKPDGTPVLIDFGVATRFPAALGREILEPAGALAGTIAYMAPEQFRRGVVDARADLYSLGCMLYEFVCGRRPFLGGSSSHLGEAHLLEPPTPPSRLVEDVPPALESLILRLLAKRPPERLGYAADVAGALGEILRQLPGAPSPRDSSSELRVSSPSPVEGTPVDDGFYLYRPEMTGRREPSERLLAAASAAMEGKGSLFYLGGESGIGKTMLAGELGKQAAVMGLRVVTGDCGSFAGGEIPEPGAGGPLQPFRRLFQAVADHCRARGADASRQLFGEQAPLLSRIEPSLESLPGLAPRPEESDLTGEAARSAILTATAELLIAFSKVQPMLLVLDDVHWADELSLAVLRLLTTPSSPLAGLPLLVLGTYRTDEAPGALRELVAAPGATDLRLGRLDEEGVATMVTEMLGMSAPPAALVRFLARTSEGNPFFVAEYVRAAVGDGVLFRYRGQWQIARGLPSSDAAYEALSLPNSLRGLVRRRLQGLNPAVTAVMEVAVVIGRNVDLALLETASEQDPGAVQDALAELLARQVLEDGGSSLRFVHEKLREHAYEVIPETRRRAIHLRVAEAIEARSAYAAHLLAHHFHAAGRPDRALPHAIAAGRQARAAGALHDAHDQLTRALRLESESARLTHPSPPLERARLRSILGEARVAVGDIDGGGEILREAYTIVRGRSIPRGRARWLLFLFVQLLAQLRHRLFPPVLRNADRDRAELEEAASIANTMGFSFMVKGQHLPMLGVLTLAANLAERAGALPVRGIPYSMLGSTFGAMGVRRLSRFYFESSRAAVADARVALLQQAQVEGYYYLTRGQWQAARAVLEPAYVQGQHMGIPHEVEGLGIARALVEILTGNNAEGRKILAEVRRTAESLGHVLHEWWARRYEALALLQEGRPREALETSAPAERGFRERGVITDLVNVLAIRAVAHQRLEQPDEALTLARHAQEMAEAHSGAADHSFELHAYVPEILLRGWAAARAADRADAPDLQRAAVASLKASGRFARIFPIGRPTFLLNRARAASIAEKNREGQRLLERAQAAAAALHMPLGPLP